MGTPVNSNSDQFPEQFQPINFAGGEVPTSAKLNTITGEAATQFQIQAIGIGNTFIHGIPNLAAALSNGPSNGSAQGAFANLTNFVNPAGNIASVPVMFTAGSQRINQISCIVGVQNPNGTWPVTLVGGQLSQDHHVINNSGTFTVVNIVIARIVSGVITDIHYGIFTPTSYPGSGPVTTFDAATDLQQSTTDYVVLAANVSLVDALVQALQNIGNVTYATQTSRINPANDLTLDTETFGATLTTEINNIENKPFTVRWHARVAQNNGAVLSGGNTTWTITGANNTPFLTGGLPSAQMMSNYISTVGGGLSVGDPSLSTFAVVNGAPIVTAGGSIVPVTATYTGTSLTISIPTANLVNVATSLPIDVYFPMKVNYRLLQSVNMNYTEEGFSAGDLIPKVIGTQYGWTTSPYPNTIANRLDTDEAQLSSTTAFANSIGSSVVPNGSFEFWTPGTPLATPNLWIMGKTLNSSWAQDTTNNMDGASALLITTGNASGNGGVVTATNQVPIPISDKSTYYLKFKTFSTSSSMKASVVANFFAGNLSPIGGPVTLWTETNANNATGTNYPTSAYTFYTAMLDNSSLITLPNFAGGGTIPSGARYVTFTFSGGGASVPSQSVWFDGITFFQPGKVGSQYFSTTPGTYDFITPGNTTHVTVTCIGAGGAGGNTPSGDSFNHGGGGGGFGGIIKVKVPVIPNTLYKAVVGTGGTATSGNGNAGGNSEFQRVDGQMWVRGSGGSGGQGFPANGPAPGGVGGSFAIGGPVVALTIINALTGNTGNATSWTSFGGSSPANHDGANGAGMNVSGNPYLTVNGGTGAGGANSGSPPAVAGGTPGGGGGGAATGPFNFSSANGGSGLVMIEF